MLNMLVINNDHNTCKRIVNNVMIYCKNIRTCGIAYTVKEATEIVRKQKIDIFILDYNMQNGVARNFLDYIDENNEDEKMSVILLVDKDENENLISNKCISKIIHKSNEISEIIYALREMSRNNKVAKQSLLKEKINKELEKMQYNFSYVGTKYMAEAIYEIYSKNYIYTGGNLSKNVYPIIAQNHNTTINNIKCNITSATRLMAQRCPKDVMENYLFCENGEVPKAKEIMYKVINRL